MQLSISPESMQGEAARTDLERTTVGAIFRGFPLSQQSDSKESRAL